MLVFLTLACIAGSSEASASGDTAFRPASESDASFRQTPSDNQFISAARTAPASSARTAPASSAPAQDAPGNQSILLRGSTQQPVFTGPLTLSGVVHYAEQNYPAILKSQAQTRAAKNNIAVQKLNEYLPDSLFQYQEVMASHNKLSQVIFGSPVFPAMTGPGYATNNMNPYFFSGAGVSLDWAPLDFGLHKSRIDLTRTQFDQSKAQFAATDLDVAVAAANAFLDTVEAFEQVRAAQENVHSFEQFCTVVHAEVDAQLKPGADASLADAQLANAKNFLLRAELSRDIALANLANSMGLAGEVLTIDPAGLTTATEIGEFQRETPLFEQVPILQVAKSAVQTSFAQKRVLNKEYYPVFHFLGGFNVRGAGLNNRGHATSHYVYGVLPPVPDYQLALIVNWNFLDYSRLHAEKKVQDQRIIQQQQEYNLVLQNLKTEDVRSRARVRAAIAIASNMPVQVKAAWDATRQATARYQTGLGSVAQVAEANQLLAQSRMQEAVAKVDIWRALLSVSAVHGDLKPFITEAEHVQGGH